MKKNQNRQRKTSKKIFSGKRAEKTFSLQLARVLITIALTVIAAAIFSSILHLTYPENCFVADKSGKVRPMEKMSGWRIYRSKEYGFEIKYPDRVAYMINDGWNSVEKAIRREIVFQIDEKSSINIFVWDKRKMQSYGSAYPENYKATNISGKPAWVGRPSQEAEGVISFHSYIYSDVYIYDIKYLGDSKRENIDLYNKMVSMFKII